MQVRTGSIIARLRSSILAKRVHRLLSVALSNIALHPAIAHLLARQPRPDRLPARLLLRLCLRTRPSNLVDWVRGRGAKPPESGLCRATGLVRHQ